MKVRLGLVRTVGAVGIIVLLAGCGGQIAGTPTRLGLAAGDNSGPGMFLPPPSGLPSAGVPGAVPGATSVVPGPTDSSAPPTVPALPSGPIPGVPESNNPPDPNPTDGSYLAPPDPGSPSAAVPGGPRTAAAGPAGVDPRAKALADRIGAAQQQVTSAHSLAVLDVGKVNETFDAQLRYAGGQLAAMSASVKLDASGSILALEFRLVGGSLYLSGADFLSSVGVTDKKWLLASPTSSNKTVADLARTFIDSTHLNAGDQSGALAAFASNVTDLGANQVNGTPAQHYSLQVDPARAAAALDGTSAAPTAPGGPPAPSGTPVTAEIWLDASDRVVKVLEDFPSDGQQIHLEITTDAFDQPVTITAPDPAAVATR